jgi:hypothetical protein
MAGPQLDDGVLKLEQFIGVLRTTIEQVGDGTDTLETHADQLDDLEGTAQNGFEDLNGALEDFEDGLDSGRQDAVEEIGELATLARDAAGQRLGEAEGEVAGGGSSFDGALNEGRDEVDQADSGLTSQGFDALGSTIDAVESSVDGAREKSDGSFDELGTGFEAFHQRVSDAFTEAEAKFDESVADLSDKANSLATDAGDCVSGFESDGGDFHSEVESLGGEVEGLYDGWDGDVDEAADDLVSSVETLMDDTAAFVETVGKDQIESPGDLVLNESFEPYLSELSELQAVVDGAAGGVAETLVSLVDELVKSESVVDTIDQLLNAVE